MLHFLQEIGAFPIEFCLKSFAIIGKRILVQLLYIANIYIIIPILQEL